MSQGSNSSTTHEAASQDIDGHLRRLASRMPGAVKFRVYNALDHFDRSFRLFEIDREMASFRAITGEEEAATALIKAIQVRRYPDAQEFNCRDHQHKAAVIACMMAIAAEVAPIMKEFQLNFDFRKRRVDIKIPLSNFNVSGGEDYAIQPIEPLDMVRGGENPNDSNPFAEALGNLAARSNYNNIKRMVSAEANGRNTLLYAADGALPVSKASLEGIANRKKKALILLVLATMVLQTRKHQSLVRQEVTAFLSVISRLPPSEPGQD